MSIIIFRVFSASLRERKCECWTTLWNSCLCSASLKVALRGQKICSNTKWFSLGLNLQLTCVGAFHISPVTFKSLRNLTRRCRANLQGTLYWHLIESLFLWQMFSPCRHLMAESVSQGQEDSKVFSVFLLPSPLCLPLGLSHSTSVSKFHSNSLFQFTLVNLSVFSFY